jgi:3-mercaptopyruvate sulfurtransferase SseA
LAMPMEQLSELVSTLEPTHDIYVYGESDERALSAVEMLRSAGCKAVTQLMGGLAAWQEIGGPTEGIDEDAKVPDANAYNVVSRLKTEQDVREAGKAQHAN